MEQKKKIKKKIEKKTTNLFFNTANTSQATIILTFHDVLLKHLNPYLEK